MDDDAFDQAVITAAFARAAEVGWERLTVAAAAREAGLPLARVRARFSGRGSVLRGFGRLADRHALAGELAAESSTRDRLFDLVMRRIDMLQTHRAGVLALFRALPVEPATAAMLACASFASMRWLLEAAGVSAAGPLGMLRAKGLLAVWLWTVRAWQRDMSEDLSATMAALDQALARADQADAWLHAGRRKPVEDAPPTPEADVTQTP